ncbi:MAG: LysM peptidoglycan-binding domain-containing M23 family metallopeptidase [Candidatus Limnocylindrus sp.]
MTRTGRERSTSSTSNPLRGARPGTLWFRLLAAARRQAIAVLRTLEQAGERALSLSLFRAGEFLRHPLPRRIRVHPRLGERTSGLAIAALLHRLTPRLEEWGVVRLISRCRTALTKRLTGFLRAPEQAAPIGIAFLLGIAVVASILPGPAVAPDRSATANEINTTSLTSNEDPLAPGALGWRPIEVARGASVGFSASSETALLDGPQILEDGTMLLPAAVGLNIQDGRIHVQVHVVQKGQTLAQIAKLYNIGLMDVVWSNRLPSTSNPPAGKRLKIPDTKGYVHVVQEHETLKSIASASRVPQSKIMAYNGLRSSDVVLGMVLVLPGGRGPALPTYQASGQSYAYNGPLPEIYSGMTFRYPVPGGRFVRGFFRGHDGMDISQATGAPILAAAAGVVVRTGWVNNCGGNQVVIAVGSNLYTGYYHLSRILVSPGQKVARGQQIGKIGDTGCTTGPHLHFSVSRGYPLASGSTFYIPARFLP